MTIDLSAVLSPRDDYLDAIAYAMAAAAVVPDDGARFKPALATIREKAGLALVDSDTSIPLRERFVNAMVRCVTNRFLELGYGSVNDWADIWQSDHNLALEDAFSNGIPLEQAAVLWGLATPALAASRTTEGLPPPPPTEDELVDVELDGEDPGFGAF